jgi:hypothetical protein
MRLQVRLADPHRLRDGTGGSDTGLRLAARCIVTRSAGRR